MIEALAGPKKFISRAGEGSLFQTVDTQTVQYRPWLDYDDAKNVFFTSVHLYQNTQSQVIERDEYDDEDSELNAPRGRNVFFPGTGSEQENTEVTDTDIYPGGILNVPMTPGQATATNWRKEFTERIFPRLFEFQPDLILVSAGFDAHEEDHIHSPGDTTITEFDYAWLTENLQKIAN
jgi:hypothetical protein